MNKKTVIASLALASGLALAGCSSNAQETSQTPSASPMAEQPEKKQTFDLNQAFYAQTSYGSHITVGFSAPAPTDIESNRKSAGIGAAEGLPGQ